MEVIDFARSFVTFVAPGRSRTAAGGVACPTTMKGKGGFRRP